MKKISFDVGDDGFDELYGHGIPVFVSPENPDEPEEPEVPEEPSEPEQPEEPKDDGISPCKLGLPMAKAFLSAAVSSMDKPESENLTEGDKVANAVGAGIKATQKFIGRIERQGQEETRDG
jgi:hypothetical protein